MLKFQGLLKGKKLKYPFEINKVDGLTTKKIEIKDEEQIIDLIGKELSDEFNKKKKTKQIMEELGFEDTLTLLDDRSRQLFECYQFYKYSPHECSDKSIWFESYNIISQIETALKPSLF